MSESRAPEPRLGAARGPTALFVPLSGVSLISVKGAPFHDPDADAALFAAVRAGLDRSRVELCELDFDINHPEFALAVANRLHDLYQQWKRA